MYFFLWENTLQGKDEGWILSSDWFLLFLFFLFFLCFLLVFCWCWLFIFFIYSMSTFYLICPIKYRVPVRPCARKLTKNCQSSLRDRDSELHRVLPQPVIGLVSVKSRCLGLHGNTEDRLLPSFLSSVHYPLSSFVNQCNEFLYL